MKILCKLYILIYLYVPDFSREPTQWVIFYSAYFTMQFDVEHPCKANFRKGQNDDFATNPGKKIQEYNLQSFHLFIYLKAGYE